jgi:hypothetical protein
MARASIVFSVLISSPSDVAAECATALTAVHDWNSTYSQQIGVMLEPVQWKTHAYPESGDRPQALINKQIVDDSDMVIAIFGHRIGTATGSAKSGTIEEIERLRDKGKRVAVYFSVAPVPHDHDPEQLRQLNEYRESLKLDTLYWTFDSTEQLYRLVSLHLGRNVSQLYQELETSKAIRVMVSQLPNVVNVPNPVSENKPDSKPPQTFRMQYVAVGEYPDGPKLRLTANKPFALLGLDYVEENGARVSSSESHTPIESRPVEGKGYMLEATVEHPKLVLIHNLKPRSGNDSIPMQFKLRLSVEGAEETRTIPAILQPSFKQVGGATTYIMKLHA